MSKYIKIGICSLLTLLVIISYTLYNKNRALSTELSIISNNQKAFISENSSIKEHNIALKLTVEQLNYYNDSIIEKMNDVKKKLNIKNSNLKQMQYMLSEASKTDTVVFKDTIFREPSLNIDTVMGDKWYNVAVGLKYPSNITVSPTFISEKYVIVNSKKETINPPKKLWIFRIFQKKHTVLEVNVVEKNPYIDTKQQRFIEIIK